MNRRLSLNSSRPRPQASPSAATPASVPDTRGSMIGAFMVWVLIIYLAVPVQYFIGDMGSTDAGGMGAGGMAAGGTDAGGTGAGGMAAPNPLARTIKLGLLRSEEHTSELQSLRHLVCR